MQHLHYDVLDSSSNHAKQLMAQHPGQALLVSADRQTAGRGRSGRRWYSPVGGAWFSVVWPIVKPEDTYVPMPLVAGLSILRGLREVIDQSMPGQLSKLNGLKLQLKWPNDVLLQGSKLAGILCERVGCSDHPAVVIGIGINLNNSPPELDGGSLRSISLHNATNQQCEVIQVINTCASQLTEAIQRLEANGFSDSCQCQINSELAWIGKPVSMLTGTKSVTGRLLGVDRQGKLILKTQDGTRTYGAGEISRLTQFDELLDSVG